MNGTWNAVVGISVKQSTSFIARRYPPRSSVLIASFFTPAMHSHVLFSLLSALATCQNLAQAAPVAQTDATVPFPKKTVTVTETFTLIREVPMSTTTGLALSELPNGLATGEQSAAATTAVSPDLPPVEEIMSSYYSKYPQFAPTSITGSATDNGLALSEVPNAVATGEQPVATQEGTTIVSPDASNTSLLPPPAVITSEFPAVLPEDAGVPSATADATSVSAPLGVATDGAVGYPASSQNPTEPEATSITQEVSATDEGVQTEVIPSATDAAPSGSVTETNQAVPTATGGLQPPTEASQAAPPGSEIVPITSTLQDGYSILPIATATDTASAFAPTSSGDPQAQAPVASGCNSTASAVKGEGKAGLGWMADSGECAGDFLQPGSKVSWYVLCLLPLFFSRRTLIRSWR